MKTSTLVLNLFFLLILTQAIKSQNYYGYCDPDSLISVTVSGDAIVTGSGMHRNYYIDEDGDGISEYILNFGPFWYEPENSLAERPMDMDYVIIEGGLNETNPGILPVIIVYKINSLFWRNPYNPFWNQLNDIYYGQGQQNSGYCPGAFKDTTLLWTEATGVTIIDTTLLYVKYFLDTNYDQVPDFKLNFGPYWYVPPVNIQLPEVGDIISVKGVWIELPKIDAIVVSELNGSIWRDSSLMSNKMAGKWITKNMAKERNIYSPFDTASRLQIRNSWHTKPLPENLFCQIITVFVQNMRQYEHEYFHEFAAFEIGVFRRHHNGFQNIMAQNQWRINFNSAIHYQFRYTDKQLKDAGIQLQEESKIRVMYWKEGNSWVEQSNIEIDTDRNLIKFDNNVLYGLFLLTTEDLFGIYKEDYLASEPTFGDIYPNPTKSSFNIPFSCLKTVKVSIMIYDMNGQKVLNTNDRYFEGGDHIITFDQVQLNPGLYFCKYLVNDSFLSSSIVSIIE